MTLSVHNFMSKDDDIINGYLFFDRESELWANSADQSFSHGCTRDDGILFRRTTENVERSVELSHA